MAWMELSLDTTHEAVDWVRTLLAKTDYVSDLQVTNYAETESTPSVSSAIAPPPWEFTLCWYLPYDLRVRARVNEIDQLLAPLHRTGLTTALEATVVEEKSALASDLHSPIYRIGQRFVVLRPDVPCPPELKDEILLRLQPSLAFGSGLHPATILSLRLVERLITPTIQTLDLGCGSGILSVAMAKLGAQVLAIDNDDTAVQATQEAVRENGVEQQVTVMTGSLGGGSSLGHWMGGETMTDVPTIEPTAAFDLIVANILARVHITLADDYRRALRHVSPNSGLLITAGFTTDHEEEVVQALKSVGFAIVGCERQEEWVALACRLHKQS